MERLIHQVHKYQWCICQSKWHHQKLVIVIPYVTPCFLQKSVSENFDFHVTLRHHQS
jgi:hypothetical protein